MTGGKSLCQKDTEVGVNLHLLLNISLSNLIYYLKSSPTILF